MMIRNETGILIFCFVILFFITGCSSDVRELNDISLVMTTGIDYDSEQNKYKVTILSIQPKTVGKEENGGHTEWIASATGDSIMDAAKNLRSRAGKRLIWQHNKIIIISKQAANHSFYEIMDFLVRNREMRMTSFLLISDGPAEDKMLVRTETEDLLTNDLLGMIRNEVEWGKSLTFMIKDIINWYTNPHRGFVTGRLITVTLEEKSKKVLALSGASVFQQGKLVGWLTREEAMGVQFLLGNKKKFPDFTITSDYQEGVKISTSVKVKKNTIRTSFENGKPKIDITLILTGTIVGISKQIKLQNTEELTELEKKVTQDVKSLIEKALSKTQEELGVDVFGFSDKFNQSNPKEWERIKSKWNQTYKNLPVDLHITLTITKLGMIQVIER